MFLPQKRRRFSVKSKGGIASGREACPEAQKADQPDRSSDPTDAGAIRDNSHSLSEPRYLLTDSGKYAGPAVDDCAAGYLESDVRYPS